VKVLKLANIKQQKKRNIQNEKRRVKNSSVKSSIRTAAKKVVKATDLKDIKEVKNEGMIKESYQNFIKLIDTAASKGIIKKTTAARKKSRLAKKVNSAVTSLNKTA
jgi:small subunit ribosomal protein S20